MELLIALSAILGIVVVALVYKPIVHGLVFYKFYAWFVLPIFIELPEISYLSSVGLIFFISLLKGSGGSHQKIKEEYCKSDYTSWYIIVGPWLALLMGWLAQMIIY